MSEKEAEPWVWRLDEVKPDQEERVKKVFALFGTIEGARLKEEYDETYGIDPLSFADWKPRDDFPHIRSVKFKNKVYPEVDQLDLLSCLRAHLFWDVLYFLQVQILNGDPSIFSLLHNPSLQLRGMEKAAHFRKHYIMPHYGTVMALHDFLCNVIGDLQQNFYVFPPGLPIMTHQDALALFQQAGDTDGEQLVQLHIDLFPSTDDLLYWCNSIATNKFNSFK